MDMYIINGVIIPLFATWFIPNTIRDPKSGEYRGFKNKIILLQLLFLGFLESQLVLDKFGMSLLSISRIIFSTSIPFIGAILFVKFTQKSRFGNEFTMSVKSEDDS